MTTPKLKRPKKEAKEFVAMMVLILLGLTVMFKSSSVIGGDNDKKRPMWADDLRPPVQADGKCYIGSASNAVTKEQALNDAYKNALINVVRGEFPELTKISERSLESLYGAEYTRNLSLRSDLVRFAGLIEHKQSPYVEINSQGNYDAYRILCWPLVAVAAEKRRLASVAQKSTPESIPEPEWQPDWGNASAIVDFDSEPQRAIVEIDGVPVCVTPCKQTVGSGKRTVAMKLAQYKPLIEEINIRNAMIIKRKLEPNFATIDIITTPPGLKVRLDSGSYGNPYVGGTVLGETPIMGVRVDAGRHELFITGDRYGEHTHRFFVKAQEHQIINLKVKGRQGGIIVDSHDERMNKVTADVYIDGALVGKTPFRAKILVGDHTLELVTKYSQSWKGNVHVLDHQVTVIDGMVK